MTMRNSASHSSLSRAGWILAWVLALTLSQSARLPAAAIDQHWASANRAPDSTQTSLAEIRAAERRRIPIEVALKAANHYSVHGPIEVTIMVTNLFDQPLLMNRRLLVNHIRLEGEISFKIIGPDGRSCELRRLVTPMSVHDDDFVVLPKGESIQRTVDLADLYEIHKQGPYKIVAVYHNDLDQPLTNLRAWKGLVASELTEIQVN